jgi:hypothetical protein
MMPRFIVSETDETDEFVKYLEGIVESFPNCTYILDDFKTESVPDKW